MLFRSRAGPAVVVVLHTVSHALGDGVVADGCLSVAWGLGESDVACDECVEDERLEVSFDFVEDLVGEVVSGVVHGEENSPHYLQSKNYYHRFQSPHTGNQNLQIADFSIYHRR